MDELLDQMFLAHEEGDTETAAEAARELSREVSQSDVSKIEDRLPEVFGLLALLFVADGGKKRRAMAATGEDEDDDVVADIEVE